MDQVVHLPPQTIPNTFLENNQAIIPHYDIQSGESTHTDIHRQGNAHHGDAPDEPITVLDLPPEIIFHILSFLPNARLNVNPLVSSPHATSITLPHDDYNTNDHVDAEYLLRAEILDPIPYYSDAQLVQKTLYSIMRTCKRFYEVSKALLWVDVGVKGGRGWISVVDGLGEYAGEDWYDVAASRARTILSESTFTTVSRVASLSSSLPDSHANEQSIPMQVEAVLSDLAQLSTSAPESNPLLGDFQQDHLHGVAHSRDGEEGMPSHQSTAFNHFALENTSKETSPKTQPITIRPAISTLSSTASAPTLTDPPPSRHISPPAWNRGNESRAPVSSWRTPPLARKTSLSRNSSLSSGHRRDRSVSFAKTSKMKNTMSPVEREEEGEEDREIIIPKDDLRIVRPGGLDSPDLDYGDTVNEFETLGLVLRNGGSLSRVNSRTKNSDGRPSLRSQSHQIGIGNRLKSKLEREKDLRLDWEKERSLSRARARERSPSVMGGRRVRSPSISRSRPRREESDVGQGGMESLMQILGKEAERRAQVEADAKLLEEQAAAASVAQSSHEPEKVPGDPDYEYEFDLPTRLPPIPQIQSLSFANFRTTGTRRTQEEAVRGKFVTSQRMYHVLKNAPRLKRLAMTEYVDSALEIEVIEEIFLRGYGFTLRDEPEHETNRRRSFEPIEALDLTGCVSSVFGKALEAFIERWLVHPKERRQKQRQRDLDMETDDERSARGRSRAVQGFGGLTAEDHLRMAEEEDEAYKEEDDAWVRPTFKHLKRLSLRGCVTLSSEVIAALVGCCSTLTHLDLSFTRVSPATLEVLGCMPEARLVALSLARSTRLNSESVRNFLCDAPAARTIVDLNMFGDTTYISPLNAVDLEWIIRLAPCFQRKQLRYLDLSSAPVSSHVLSSEIFPSQPGLRSLGLSYIPHLPLDGVAQFILKSVPNIEILTFTHSSTLADLPLTLPALQTMMVLHGKLINPLTSPPFKIMSGPGPRGPHQDSPTRLRIIELSETVRRALGRSGGSATWRVTRSKGARGWFVDVSAGWVREFDQVLGRRVYRFLRGLDKSHQWRRYLDALADAEGKVGSSVGWHSRKMEVLRGLGMMAREEGLYGAGAFAFEG